MGILSLTHILVGIQCMDHHSIPECIYMHRLHCVVHTMHLLRMENRDMVQLVHLFMKYIIETINEKIQTKP